MPITRDRPLHVVEDATGLIVEDAADENVGEVALMLWELTHETSEAELVGVVSIDQLADPLSARLIIADPTAKLRGLGVAFLQSLGNRFK